jgi:hypothetical protein
VKHASIYSPFVLALAGCTSTGSTPRGNEPMTNQDALVIYSAGFERMFTDPRDAGLKSALTLLDDRLLDLPAELGEGAFPRPMGELARDVIASPMALRIAIDEGGDWSQRPPVRAQLEVHGTPEELRSISQRADGLLGMAMQGAMQPVEGTRLAHAQLPMGTLHAGFASAEPDAPYVLAFNEPRSGDLGLGSLDLPRGIEPDFAFKVDLGRLRGPIEMAIEQAGPGADDVRRQLKLMGLTFDHPMVITVAVGHGDDRSFIASRVTNWAATQRALGALADAPLSAEDLRVVPADATLAWLSRSDLSYVVQMLETLGAEIGQDPLGMIRGFLGIDLESDLIGPLGTTFGMYFSDSTGGGGLASAVLFASVENGERLAETLEHLMSTANGLSAGEAKGYVAFRDWHHGSTHCWSLRFPGLPVPVEPSLSVSDGYVFVAATPQALVGALDQRATKGPGLTSNPRFRAMVDGSLADLQSLSFTDTERLLADGYGFATLFASALANGVRSPRDPGREPGLVLPSYGELVRGARASLTLGRIEGEDLVMTGEADASFLANLTAFCGGPFMPLIGGLAGMAAIGATRVQQQVMQLEQLEQLEHLEHPDEHGRQDDASE